MTAWGNYAVAQVGASAALVGLLFVAVSINLTRILAIAGLPNRALEALILLANVLVTGSLVLVPGQSLRLLGGELLGTSVLAWVSVTVVQVHRLRVMDARYRRPFAIFVALSQSATLPFIIGGAVALTGNGAGLYWLVPGDLCAIVVALANAWVLLVEINR